jgi:putative photosynthetic complex assembly protein
LLGLALLVVLSLTAVGSVRLVGKGDSSLLPTNARAIDSRDLRFVDLGKGKVGIYDWDDGGLVRTLQPGDENFIRGVIRGFARERRMDEVDHEQPFRISRLDDGQLTLEDLATHRMLVLQAFGTTNAKAFESLLSRQTKTASNG